MPGRGRNKDRGRFGSAEAAKKGGLKNDPIETSIQDNADAFAKELRDLATFADMNYEAIVSKTVIDLFRMIVTRTPVDTGRAKANWFLDYNPDREPGKFDDENFPDFDYVLTDADVIWIYNNLEYIIPLEEGWSDQAPQGMVGMSLRDFTTFLKININKLSDIAFPT